MHEVEIWIDVTAREGAHPDAMCTLFARRAFAVCPRQGESLSFHQSKGSDVEFKLASEIGALRHNSVSVTVEEVSHYSVMDGGSHVVTTSLRCSSIAAASREDAKLVVAFMTSQAGFEVDPYGLNTLGA